MARAGKEPTSDEAAAPRDPLFEEEEGEDPPAAVPLELEATWAALDTVSGLEVLTEDVLRGEGDSGLKKSQMSIVSS